MLSKYLNNMILLLLLYFLGGIKLKKKIFGILVCMLMIAVIILPVSGNLKIQSEKDKKINTNLSKSIEVNSLNMQPSRTVFNERLEGLIDRSEAEFFFDVKQTTDGGYIATGYVDVQDGYDCWLLKTDSNGDEQWNKTYNLLGGLQCGLSVQQTDDGGYIINGYNHYPTHAYADFILIKTDSNGNEQWNKTFGQQTTDILDCGFCVQQTDDGGYIITGLTQADGLDYYDVWLIKTYSNGVEQWNKTFGGFNDDRGFYVLQDDDYYIIAGLEGYGGPNQGDACLIKTDSSGNEIWSKSFGGDLWDQANCVQKTTDGYIIVGSTSSFGLDEYDFWLIKTDSNGNEMWNKSFAGGGITTTAFAVLFKFIGGISIQTTSDSGYIFAGITNAFGSGENDVMLIKTDSNGNEQWNKTFGGELGDEGYGINLTSDGGYIICGRTISYGNHDAWLIKTDSNGNEEWNKTYKRLLTSENDPPEDPSQPEGPEEGATGIEYTFNTSTEDPDGDDVYYKFDWGDGTNSGWVGPYSSGDIGSASHNWNDEGDFLIKAKARDVYAEDSDWSLPLTIHIVATNNPPYKPKIEGLKEIKVGEENEYTFSAKDPEEQNVSYRIEWGDGTDSGWLDYVESETEIKLNHTWEDKGNFEIRCKAKDIYGAESEEATLRVTVPKNKPFNSNFNLFNWLLNQFPNAFPILKYILG